MSKPTVLINIVLYHPEKDMVMNLVKICSQYEKIKIFLFDNSEREQYFEFDDNRIIYFKSPKNVGVGGAHYTACQMAEAENFDFVLFFDQDSQLPPCFINDLISGFYRLQKSYPRLCAIGPAWNDPRFLGQEKISGLKNKLRKLLRAPDLSHVLISSGMLIWVPTLKVIGYPKREYFIDLVDTEWCLRALYKNYQVVELTDIQIEHTIGEVRWIRGFPLRYWNPVRYYYRIRNSLFLFTEKQILFSFRFYILMSNLFTIRKILFVPKPIDSLLAALRGIKDGFLNKKSYL